MKGGAITTCARATGLNRNYPGKLGHVVTFLRKDIMKLSLTENCLSRTLIVGSTGTPMT